MNADDVTLNMFAGSGMEVGSGSEIDIDGTFTVGDAFNANSLEIADSASVTMTKAQLGGFEDTIVGEDITVELTDALEADDLDSITLPDGATVELHDDNNALTPADGVVGDGDSVTIDGSGLADTNALTFDASNKSNGSYEVKCGDGTDTVELGGLLGTGHDTYINIENVDITSTDNNVYNLSDQDQNGQDLNITGNTGNEVQMGTGKI